MADIIYMRLDNRGEIHAVEEGKTQTLCGENCQTWFQVPDPGARHPSACPECATLVSEMEKPKEEKKKKTERPPKKEKSETKTETKTKTEEKEEASGNDEAKTKTDDAGTEESE
jgi:hypothetical protein